MSREDRWTYEVKFNSISSRYAGEASVAVGLLRDFSSCLTISLIDCPSLRHPAFKIATLSWEKFSSMYLFNCCRPLGVARSEENVFTSLLDSICFAAVFSLSESLPVMRSFPPAAPMRFASSSPIPLEPPVTNTEAVDQSIHGEGRRARKELLEKMEEREDIGKRERERGGEGKRNEGGASVGNNDLTVNVRQQY